MSRIGAFFGRLVGRAAGTAKRALMPEAAAEESDELERQRLIAELSTQNRAGRRETVALLRARPVARKNRRKRRARR